MFGYISICREGLGEEDANTFRAYYCGLCKAVGRECSHISRLGLSYDITFLALVLSSALFENADITEERCAVHPFKKHPCVVNDKAVDYAARVGEILTYLKLKDDEGDEGGVKVKIAMAALRRGKNKAVAKNKEAYDFISDRLSELSLLEKQNCSVLDEVADKFAKILEYVFTPDFVTDNDTRRILSWFGYNLGRWLYIIDAYDDIEKDYKSGAYNPFIAKADGDAEKIKSEIRERAEFTLTLTLENTASALELLKLHRNRKLIENIVYQGLKGKQKSVLGEE